VLKQFSLRQDSLAELDFPWSVDKTKVLLQGHECSVILDTEETEELSPDEVYWELAVREGATWMVLGRLYWRCTEHQTGEDAPNLKAWVRAQVAQWASEQEAYLSYYCP